MTQPAQLSKAGAGLQLSIKNGSSVATLYLSESSEHMRVGSSKDMIKISPGHELVFGGVPEIYAIADGPSALALIMEQVGPDSVVRTEIIVPMEEPWDKDLPLEDGTFLDGDDDDIDPDWGLEQEYEV